jgi:hypothetical protein
MAATWEKKIFDLTKILYHDPRHEVQYATTQLSHSVIHQCDSYYLKETLRPHALSRQKQKVFK